MKCANTAAAWTWCTRFHNDKKMRFVDLMTTETVEFDYRGQPHKELRNLELQGSQGCLLKEYASIYSSIVARTHGMSWRARNLGT